MGKDRAILCRRDLPLGETVRRVTVNGILFRDPDGDETRFEVDASVVMELSDGRFFGVFGSSLIEMWKDQQDEYFGMWQSPAYLRRTADAGSKEATDRLQILCGRRLEEVRFRDFWLELIFDGGLRMKSCYGIEDEFSCIHLTERPEPPDPEDIRF